MTQRVIQVGTTPNDGQGTPLRNSFIICNENFSELYARAQVSPPPTLHGSLGDEAGWYAYDSNFFYYCFQNYTNGTATIWAQVSQVANVVVTNINDGTSNVSIAGINGNVTTSVNGTPNVVVITTAGQFVSGTISATGDVVAGPTSYFVGNGSQLTGLPATYTNSNVATFLAAFGSNTVTTSGNVTGGNIISLGAVTATGNVTGAYLIGNGSQITGLPPTYANSNATALLANFGSNSISTTGNIAGGNVNAVQVTTSGNVRTVGQISAAGNITTAGYFVGTFVGNVVATLTNIPGPGGAVVYNNGAGNAAATAGLVYTATGPNVLTVLGSYSATGNVLAVGNVSGGNLLTLGAVSSAGNVTGSYIIGNGSQLTGLPASYTNSNVITLLAAFGSNTILTTGNITSGNTIVTGLVSAAGGINSGTLVIAQGNIRGGNIISNGLITATGDIFGGNLWATGQISATGNLVSNYIQSIADINAGGNISATNYTGFGVSVVGNVTAGNIIASGIVSTSGNITGGNISTSGAFGVASLSASGNITSGNILTTGLISATSTITSNANITGANVLTGGLISATSTITSNANITGANLLTAGIVSATANIIGGNITTGGQVTAGGNVTGANILTNGIISSTGNAIHGNVLTNGIISSTGNAIHGNLTVGAGTITVGNIVTTGNTVANIGSLANQFNYVFARATSAQYADLAENYAADRDYAAGTVVIFGGEKEITISTDIADERVAGVISTDPAHLMNAAMSGLPVALRGRVPVQVVGPVTKGDSLVTGSTAGHAQSVGRSRLYGQAVFAKALETNLEDGEKTIIAVIL